MKASLPFVPRYCVWELTLACNANCIHCGSLAGDPRGDELSTDEALALVQQLKAAGTASITLSGGEPLMRTDWPLIAKEIRRQGIRVEIITNGLLVEEQIEQIVSADFFAVTFSIDGDQAVHDGLRNTREGLERLLRGARALKDRGVTIGAATQVNVHNVDCLEAVHSLLLKNGFSGWQVQLTMPRGQAACHEQMCVSPDDLPAIETALVNIRNRSPLFIQAADNFGYMDKYEPVLRGGDPGEERFFRGCQAGMRVVGITSDGTVKGCLSQDATFNEGNVRHNSFQDIWNSDDAFSYNRQFDLSSLDGACANCPFNTICRAGCKSLAKSTGDTISQNKYCLRRQMESWS